MSQQAQSVQIDPNDPRLHTLEYEGYHRKRSKILFELDANLASKAKEHDDCGKMAESLGCSRHDSPVIVKEKARTCKQRFTNCCSRRITDKRMEKIDWLLEMIYHAQGDSTLPQKIALITIDQPLPRTREMVELAQSAIFNLSDKLRKPIAKTLHYVRPCIKGFADGRLISQVVYWGQDPIPERIKAHYGQLGFGTEVRVRVRDLSHAEDMFREAFTFLVPMDSREQAELEVLFNRIDMTTAYQHDVFLRHSTELLIPSTEKQSLEGTTADHDPMSCDGCEVDYDPLCPVCNEPADLVSGLHLLHAPPEVVQAAGWRRMYKKPPG